jgi:hypothetical protein
MLSRLPGYYPTKRWTSWASWANYQDRINAAIDEAGGNLKSSQAQPTCGRAGALDAVAGLAQNKSLLGGVLVDKI